jgi:DeoR/GlpR family transcriptional regulator of sugar metabolism
MESELSVLQHATLAACVAADGSIRVADLVELHGGSKATARVSVRA